MPIEHKGRLYSLPLPKHNGRRLDAGEVPGEEPEGPIIAPEDADPSPPAGMGFLPLSGAADVDEPLDFDMPFAPEDFGQGPPDVEPDQMVGPYDAWLGKVEMVHTVGTNTLSSYKQEIFATRVGVHYQTNNDPQGYAVPTVASQLTPQGVTALPWPVRHDQAEYLVKVGDIVTILTGRDGRHYYMIDDSPFMGIVVAHMDANYTVIARQDDPPTTPHPGDRYLVGTAGTGDWSALSENVVEWSGAAWSSTETPDSGVIVYVADDDTYREGDGSKFDAKSIVVTESNVGGAGVRTIKVVRQALAGNAGEQRYVQTDFSDLQDAASADIVYPNVSVIRGWQIGHGYRIGDPVWVSRRGLYFFCLPANADTFVGRIVIDGANSGPDGESDFVTNHYWVREATATVAYTNNQYTLTWSNVELNPTANPALPRIGRWVDAENVAESAGGHGLVHNDEVLVTTVYDSSGSATSITDKGHAYVFSRVPMIETDVMVTNGLLYWDGTQINVIAAPGDEQILKWTVADGFEWIADPS